MKITKNLSKDEKKMLHQIFWRSQTIFASVSPAKMGGAGFCYSMMPVIDRFYKNNQKKKNEALQRHMSYFSITIPFTSFIMGIAASMEKKNSESNDFDTDSINAIKTSLMGPLSGIGDSLFWGVWRVICAGITIGLAKSGNIIAPILFLLMFNIPAWLIRYYGGFLGYSLGTKYIERLYSEGLINILTKAASIVGLTMVGAMTSQLVIFKTVVKMSMNGNSVMNLQKILDSIFIGIVPLTLTLIFFKLLKKGVSVNSLIIGCIVLGVVLKMVGIC